MSDYLPGGKLASIRDVARVAGVSHQTVSRVLNDHASIRDDTKDRVLAAMQELNYQPNRAARELVTSRSRTIGVLAALRGAYGSSFTITAIESAARSAGYWASAVNVEGTIPASIAAGVQYLLAQGVAGLVIIAPQQRTLDTIAGMAIELPCVTLHSVGSGSAKIIGVDQVEGARLATRYLIERGHRDIYHLGGPQDWFEAEARMTGFLKEMTEQELPITAPILGDWSANFGYYAGQELLRVRDFTAIFAANDNMALGLMHAVWDAGLDVPGDVSIVGFDDIPEAAHFLPPLTTVRQDFAEMGRRCVALLLGDIDMRARAHPEQLVLELVIRDSVRQLNR